jgi:hypothetical protein
MLYLQLKLKKAALSGFLFIWNRHLVATARSAIPRRTGLAFRLAHLACSAPYREFESLSLRQLGRSRLFSVRGCWQFSPVLAAILI